MALPSKNGSGQPTAIRLSDELKRAIDAWAASQPGGMSRSEAVRALLTEHLRELGFFGQGQVEGLRPDQLTSENDG